MAGEKPGQTRASDFFLPFDETLHVDGKALECPQIGLERLDVSEDLALVIGGASPEEIRPHDRGFEGGNAPGGQGIRGLHVVVSVDEHGRAPRRAHPLAVDHGVAGGLQHGDSLEADSTEMTREPARAAAKIVGAARQGAHGRKANEVHEL